MKVKKVYESENSRVKITTGNKLANKLAKKFFKNTIGFNRIHIEYNNYDKNSLNFYVVFDSVSPHIVEDLQKLLTFLGYNKNNWAFEISDIGGDIREKAFYELHLKGETISALLNKLEIEEDTKKYNI